MVKNNDSTFNCLVNICNDYEYYRNSILNIYYYNNKYKMSTYENINIKTFTENPTRQNWEKVSKTDKKSFIIALKNKQNPKSNYTELLEKITVFEHENNIRKHLEHLENAKKELLEIDVKIRDATRDNLQQELKILKDKREKETQNMKSTLETLKKYSGDAKQSPMFEEINILKEKVVESWETYLSKLLTLVTQLTVKLKEKNKEVSIEKLKNICSKQNFDDDDIYIINSTMNNCFEKLKEISKVLKINNLSTIQAEFKKAMNNLIRKEQEMKIERMTLPQEGEYPDNNETERKAAAERRKAEQAAAKEKREAEKAAEEEKRKADAAAQKELEEKMREQQKLDREAEKRRKEKEELIQRQKKEAENKEIEERRAAEAAAKEEKRKADKAARERAEAERKAQKRAEEEKREADAAAEEERRKADAERQAAEKQAAEAQQRMDREAKKKKQADEKASAENKKQIKKAQQNKFNQTFNEIENAYKGATQELKAITKLDKDAAKVKDNLKRLIDQVKRLDEKIKKEPDYDLEKFGKEIDKLESDYKKLISNPYDNLQNLKNTTIGKRQELGTKCADILAKIKSVCGQDSTNLIEFGSQIKRNQNKCKGFFDKIKTMVMSLASTTDNIQKTIEDMVAMKSVFDGIFQILQGIRKSRQNTSRADVRVEIDVKGADAETVISEREVIQETPGGGVISSQTEVIEETSGGAVISSQTEVIEETPGGDVISSQTEVIEASPGLTQEEKEARAFASISVPIERIHENNRRLREMHESENGYAEYLARMEASDSDADY
jgi:hypothetical protein